MCHLPSSYVVVENVRGLPDIVMVGGGVGSVEEMLTAISGSIASGESVASDARFELVNGLEAVDVELLRQIDGVIGFEVENMSNRFPFETLVKVWLGYGENDDVVGGVASLPLSYGRAVQNLDAVTT